MKKTIYNDTSPVKYFCRTWLLLFVTTIFIFSSAHAQVITRSGSQLMRGGQPYKFVGFNAFTLTGCGAVPNDTELNAYFASLRPGSITRVWAFQSQQAGIARVVNAAAAHGQMLIMCLSDGRSHCGDTDGAPGGDGSGKTDAWYQNGFRTNYKPWVTTCVNLYKNSSAIGMWEIQNEPGGGPGNTVLKAFFDEIAAHIKSLDNNHLVATGSWAEWAYGGQAGFELLHSGPNIDAGSLHEYDYDYNNSRTIVSSHYQPCLNAMNNLNKVFYVGEMGAVAASSSCFTTIPQRAGAMVQKFDAYVKNGGARGALVWNWSPGTASGCNMEVRPADPLVQMTRDYVLPGGGGGDTQAPSVPAGLSTSAVTQTTLTLSWTASTDNVGVTGYEVFRNGTSIGTPSGTSFNVTGLTCNTAYTFTVRARDAVPNWSAQSSGANATTSACSGSTNLALGKTATASTVEVAGREASKAIDGNSTTTRWAANFTGDPQWIYVDLGTPTNVNRVVLRWETAYATGYQIQVSNNASTWTNVFSTTTGNGATDDISFTTTSARYVRMNGTARANPSYSYSLFEFEIYSDGTADTQAPSVPTGMATSGVTTTSLTLTWTASTDNVAVTGYEVFRNGTSIGTPAGTSFNVTGLTCNTSYAFTVRARDAVPNWSAQSAAHNRTTSACATSTNLALSKPATASSVEVAGREASKAVDGDATTTRWSSTQGGSAAQWIYVDLGGTFSVNRVVLMWEGAYATGYQIQVSNDASSWTNVFTTTTGNGATDDITFTAVNTRYVRMYGTTKVNVNWGMSLFEFQIWGVSAGPPPAFASGQVTEEKETVFVQYPNPTKGKINILLPEDFHQGADLTVFNASGKSVLNQNLKGREHTIDITQSPGGLYIIKIFNGQRRITQKIVKE